MILYPYFDPGCKIFNLGGGSIISVCLYYGVICSKTGCLHWDFSV
uniref:Uncharacterized protein n=1 Tax=Anguilla anguilla TaxID=7936 RepID=A0A0E9V624_ANGAN